MPTAIQIPVFTKFFAEGKTKIIHFAARGRLTVALIESKDDITAGDGLRRAVMAGKGKVATETTCNVFQLLEENDIATHFIDREGGNSFIAHPCRMIPIECVARRIAYGSYLKRNLHARKGDQFELPFIEFFLKDDDRHDPLIVVKDFDIELHKPSQPVSSESLLETRRIVGNVIENIPPGAKEFRRVTQTMASITETVFEILETAFSEQDVVLVDLKIEFGFDPYGRLVVADVIDNDSWRIWPEGDETKMLDKQVFRNAADPTPADLERILGNYRQVAEITSCF